MTEAKREYSGAALSSFILALGHSHGVVEKILADAGVEVELRRFPDLVHGFLHYVGVGRSGRAAMTEIAGRLRAALA